MLMCFSVIHHHTIIHTTTSQLFELLATVRVAEQINQLQHSWWIQHATRIGYISKKHPSKWQDIHTVTLTHARTHTRPISCPDVSKGHWPPLSSTSSVPPTRVPRGKLWSDNNLHRCLLTIILLLLPMSSSVISYSWHFLPPSSYHPPQIIPWVCNLRRYTGDVIHFKGHQKRGKLKPRITSRVKTLLTDSGNKTL